MRRHLVATLGVMVLILSCPFAEGATHIANADIQVFGTIGWGGLSGYVESIRIEKSSHGGLL